MYDAASLKQIKSRIHSELPETITVQRREPIIEIGFMTTLDMNRPLRYQTVSVAEERSSKLIGILLCHPNSPLAKSEIIGHLPHFHVRSGDAIDFFCAGYGAYWPSNHFSDQTPVVEIDGEKWLFSETAFSNLIDELENETKWKYSGETELVLVAVRKKNDGKLEFAYDEAIVCNLERMSEDKAFTSVRAFFSDIFRYAKKNQQANSAWEFSDQKGLGIGVGVLKDFVVSLLPEALKGGYKKASHYAVKNIATDF